MPWIQKKNRNKHKLTKAHEESLARSRLNNNTNISDEAISCQEDRQPLFLNLDGVTPSLPGDFVVREPSRREQDVHMNVGESNMWDTFDSGQYTIQMDDPEEARQEKLRDFERRVQEYNLWAGVEGNMLEGSEIETSVRLDEQEHEEALLSILEATGMPQFRRAVAKPSLIKHLLSQQMFLRQTNLPTFTIKSVLKATRTGLHIHPKFCSFSTPLTICHGYEFLPA